MAIASAPEPVHERVLAAMGARNVRDLGGYPTADGRYTRWRTLFRADSLHRLTPEGQDALLAAGVRSVIDLRREDEALESPNPFASSPSVRYVRISLQDQPLDQLGGLASLEHLYRTILDDSQAQIVAVFRALLAPGALPALFHCTAGKDRTGIVAALLLGAAGVPREYVAEDYFLSASCLGDTFVEEARAFVARRGWSWDEMGFLWGCTPDLIVSAIHYLDGRYGGIVPYLLSAGVSEGEIGLLRGCFTA